MKDLENSQSSHAMKAAVMNGETFLDKHISEFRDPDADLIKACQSGDIESFGVLVERHQRAIRSLISRMVSQDDVEDMLQEVFIQAFTHLNRFRGDSSFKTWLHRIAVNQTLKKIGHAKRRRNIRLELDEQIAAETIAQDPNLQPENVAEREQQAQWIQKCVEKLPPKQRLVVVMRYYEDHSCEEIAEILGCSVGTVWSRLHYACKALKQNLQEMVEG